MFSFLRNHAENFLSAAEKAQIIAAIKVAEQQTSGEVRVFFESRCRFVDPMLRAAEVFFGLKMDLTTDRNGVLLYVATRDHQYAIFGDEGIFKEMGPGFWEAEAAKMLVHFKKENFVEGICTVVTEVGEALKSHFPYDHKGDKNELPDELVFGK